MRIQVIVHTLLVLLLTAHVAAQERTPESSSPPSQVSKSTFRFNTEEPDLFQRTEPAKTPVSRLPVFSQLTPELRGSNGDLRIRVFGNFSFVAEQKHRSLPGQRFVSGQFERFRPTFDTRLGTLIPGAKFHWSDRPWEREFSFKLTIRPKRFLF